MKNYQTNQLRNVGVVAHGGAGKTSLAEAMLFNTGVINRLGRVEDGTTVADFHPEEIKKQITIHTSLIPCEWSNNKINLLDTPGYSDFIGDVKGALRVSDGALFVVDAVAGVEVQTEIIWDMANENELPRMVFVNKMDRENANFTKVLANLQEELPATYAPVLIPMGEAETFKGVVDILNMKAFDMSGKDIPVPSDMEGDITGYREKLVEAAAENDDEIMMKYLEGEELTDDEIKLGLRNGIAAAKLVPVMAGSATKNIGVKQLLDFVAEYFPAPQDKSGEPLAALVFKTLVDPYVGKMNFIRVFTGVLKSDTPIYNNDKEKADKIGQILFVRGKTQQPITEAPCGDIVALVKMQFTDTNDTLCTKEKPVSLEKIQFPKPTLTIPIEPKSKGDEDKLGNAINRTLEEDPTLKVERNTETKQTLLTGMGEAHLDITLDKFKRKFGVDVEIKEIRVPYRETIRGTTQVEGKHKKQTGGHGQFGHVWLRMEPLAEGSFEFKEEIFGGSVPRQYIPAVEKGVREALVEGVLAGYPVTDIKVVLYDGSFHPVDSSEMAFKIAAAHAFKKGAQLAKPVMLEPIMNVEVVVPENFMGDIISDFNTKRGRILGMDPAGKKTTVKAQAPLSEMYRYAIDLKSITQGRGSFTMEFDHYEEVPTQLADKIIKKAQEDKAAAEK